ncbi:ATP-grasp domain-containing protein [Crocinitomicaceae bacterium]|jgi:D-alanine-D-alanine ligase|nr:ATP-grasp domain-containing protein [Crocinitomicaceae bacterium]MDG1035923.1 ATP-grasp domain-containing protein [Crocinitomicaceae bacterium]
MKKFGIICGGFSSEFDISVKSARNILKNFPDAYDAYLIYLQRDGWFIEVNGIKLSLNSIDFTFNNGVDKIDAVIVYIHGDPGENGKIQAYLDMIGLPYVNSGPLASQLSFDKWYCNEFLRGFGYNVAKSIYFSDAREVGDVEQMIEELGLPIFVKPCDSGSSYGIAKVKEVGQLSAAIEDAFAEGESVILESFLDGVEVTCGAYRTSEGIQTLPLTEIVSENDFFDYEAKYQGLSEEITPARISENSTIQVQKITKEIYQLLNLRSIARIDFILVGGIPFVIEVNTTPGFSDESIVPKMLSSASISTKGFWTEIIGAELDQ